MNRHFIPYIIVFLLFACSEEKTEDIGTYEERAGAAIETLRNELLAPENGWKVEYRPTNESGKYLIFLKFEEDGTVNIKSDVGVNNGEFFDHTILYRIDNSLNVELILTTYGVFHYFFEKDQATFGGEFEFLYKGKDDGDGLIFASKSDVTLPFTILNFIPATSSDFDDLSFVASSNLPYFVTNTPKVLEELPRSIQVNLVEQDIVLIFSIDPDRRIIRITYSGSGSSIEEAIGNGTGRPQDQTSTFIILNDKFILDEPFAFVVGGSRIDVTEILLDDFQWTGPVYCVDSLQNSGPLFNGNMSGEGDLTMIHSPFDASGMNFIPQTDAPYSVNVFFIADENSLSLEQYIQGFFPGVVGFQFNYNFQDTDQPPYALGFIMEDVDGFQYTYLREFDPTTTNINRVDINLNDNYYFSKTPEAGDQENLEQLTDMLFEGGQTYAFDMSSIFEGVFKLHNPCNKYEIFLVQ